MFAFPSTPDLVAWATSCRMLTETGCLLRLWGACGKSRFGGPCYSLRRLISRLFENRAAPGTLRLGDSDFFARLLVIALNCAIMF